MMAPIYLLEILWTAKLMTRPPEEGCMICFETEVEAGRMLECGHRCAQTPEHAGLTDPLTNLSTHVCRMCDSCFITKSRTCTEGKADDATPGDPQRCPLCRAIISTSGVWQSRSAALKSGAAVP